MSYSIYSRLLGLFIAVSFATNAGAYTWYEILDVSEDASPQAILNIPENSDAKDASRAFRKLSLVYHPDKWREKNALGPRGEAISEEDNTAVYSKLASALEQIHGGPSEVNRILVELTQLFRNWEKSRQEKDQAWEKLRQERNAEISFNNKMYGLAGAAMIGGYFLLKRFRPANAGRAWDIQNNLGFVFATLALGWVAYQNNEQAL